MDKVNAIFNTLVTPRNNSNRSKIVSFQQSFKGITFQNPWIPQFKLKSGPESELAHYIRVVRK